VAVWNGTILGTGAEPGKRMMIDGANVDRAGRATVPLGIGGDQDHCRGMTSARDRIVLEKVNGGRAISDYRKDQIVYTQGEPADSVFHIQSGKVKKTVVSEQSRGRTSGDRRFLWGRVLDRTCSPRPSMTQSVMALWDARKQDIETSDSAPGLLVRLRSA
jgi:hypothetical protein